jgi:hypothetical protein
MIAEMGVGQDRSWLEVWVRDRVLGAAGRLARNSSVGAFELPLPGFCRSDPHGESRFRRLGCGLMLQPRNSNRFGEPTYSRTRMESEDLPGAASIGGV